MAHRKHTRCAVCSTVGHHWYFEVQWRRSCDPIWSWAGGWTCAACSSNLRLAIDELRPSLLTFDA